MESSQDRLPIIEVTEQNFSEIYPFLIKSIQNCSFIAVDVVSSIISTERYCNGTVLMLIYLCKFVLFGLLF